MKLYQDPQKWMDNALIIGVGSILVFMVLSLLFAPLAHSSEIVRIAKSQIGQGEVFGDNKGPAVIKYTRGKEVAWCAGFVSWTMNKAGKMNGKYYLSARQFWNHEKRVKNPRPGDIIVFSRGNNPALGHVGIVEKVENGTITTIEGNTGNYPSKVKRITYTKKPKNLLGYVRM